MIHHDIETGKLLIACDKCSRLFKHNLDNRTGALFHIEQKLKEAGWYQNIETAGILGATLICPMCTDIAVLHGLLKEA